MSPSLSSIFWVLLPLAGCPHKSFYFNRFRCARNRLGWSFSPVCTHFRQLSSGNTHPGPLEIQGCVSTSCWIADRAIQNCPPRAPAPGAGSGPTQLDPPISTPPLVPRDTTLRACPWCWDLKIP